MPPGTALRETGPDSRTDPGSGPGPPKGCCQDATRAVRSRVANDSQTVERLLDRSSVPPRAGLARHLCGSGAPALRFMRSACTKPAGSASSSG